VRTHPSARFEGTASVHTPDPPSPLAQAAAAHLEVQGAVKTPGGVHAALTDGASAIELIHADDAVYVRIAATLNGLVPQPYTRVDDGTGQLLRLRAMQARSFDVAGLLGAARAPRVLKRHAGTTTVEADVVPSTTIRAVIGRTGALRSLDTTTRGAATLRARIQFRNWGDQAVRVAAPPPNRLDPTPGVDEIGLAAFTTAPLLMPKTLPPGWKLVGADVLSADDTEEGCAQAHLAYENPHADGFLSLYEFPRACAAAKTAAAPYPYVQITVGNTTVQAVSDLKADALARILSALVPLALRSS
jgi:hypothetical protein